MQSLVTCPTLARALADRNYLEPTPVQSAVLAEEVAGRDILVSAQTGSGKTVAYGLALGPDLLEESGRIRLTGGPLALIIAPTRELAMQVNRELEWLYAQTGARMTSCVGGMDPQAERRRLQRGVDIVIGTPGRLRDHIERGALLLSDLAAIVLDEADEMLDLGFREDLEFILEQTPPERRTLLFSATIPRGIEAMARRYQRNALRIEVAGNESGHADIEYRAIRVQPKETEQAVVNLLRFVEAQTAIVFCNTREASRHLQATLLERGFSAVLLSGELSQHERNHSLQALRDGRARVCVATDVAARGIDIPDLGLVIHAELPNDAESLQHRSGRTGRAGRKGISALLVPPVRMRRTEFMLRDAGLTPQWSGPPTAEEIRALDRQRLLHDPMLKEEPSEDDFQMAAALLAERTPEQLCAALLRIWRARLPSPEDISDPGVQQRRDKNQKSYEPLESPRAIARTPRERFDGGVWFRMDVGRKKNADPKWLLPMLCRKGGVGKGDIGAIRIFDNETKFAVSDAMADLFARNAKRPGGENIRIERLAEQGDPGSAPAGDFRRGPPKPKFKPKQASHAGHEAPAGPAPYEKPKKHKKKFKGARDGKPE